MPEIHMIVAVASNGVIGKDNAMPWHLPSDLKLFKQRTSGHAVIMGRKTLASIGKPLPNRDNIVLSRDKGFQCENVQVARSAKAAIDMARANGHERVYIIGGGEIYYLFRNKVEFIQITQIDAEPEGDTRLDLGYDKRKKQVGKLRQRLDSVRDEELSNALWLRNAPNALWLRIGLDKRRWDEVECGEWQQKKDDEYRFRQIILRKSHRPSADSNKMKDLFGREVVSTPSAR